MTVSSVPDPQMAEARKPAAAETKSTDDAVVEISYDLSSNGHNSVTSGGNAGTATDIVRGPLWTNILLSSVRPVVA